MSILTLIAVVVVVCLIVWILQSWGMPQPTKNIVYAVLLLLCVLLLLSLFGLIPSVVRVK